MRAYSNGYIIGFAAAVCLVCSIVVSTSAVALQRAPGPNKVLDRQKKVLVVAGLLEEGQAATAARGRGSSSRATSSPRSSISRPASTTTGVGRRDVTTSARRPRTRR